ncbi:ImmA/IrrE family metallo-endopeptidase [Pseudomonas sp. ANT_J12]|uniref:ImmA/IrrE family metallo-endopeptidase n=1 Tax=Pseudomonas sp. ANT_J12 TaxID=2597351 RepID=UPI0015B69905|nr:ImmA/IrrE family metallo-endopeptidase [Pseudomonas sp. ANT_J12]
MDDASIPVTIKSAFSSLKAAGYPRSYIEKLLPDWWDNSLFKTSAGALQFALILKQRLGLEASFGLEGQLLIQSDPRGARFKRRSGTKESELCVAAGLGVAMTKLALFCSKTTYTPPTCNPTLLREEILSINGNNHVDFEGLLKLCWSHGIPVLYLKDLPRASKRMTGMALSVDGRPAIVLGFSSTQHPRQLFVLAHELGHILCGHLGKDGILIDEDIVEVTDTLIETNNQRKDTEEREADAFALALIRNGHQDPLSSMGRVGSATALAAKAAVLGQELGIDPGHLILSYAKDHNDWARANQALEYSPSQPSAINVVGRYFQDGVSLDALSLENQKYLLSIQGFGE